MVVSVCVIEDCITIAGIQRDHVRVTIAPIHRDGVVVECVDVDEIHSEGKRLALVYNSAAAQCQIDRIDRDVVRVGILEFAEVDRCATGINHGAVDSVGVGSERAGQPAAVERDQVLVSGTIESLATTNSEVRIDRRVDDNLIGVNAGVDEYLALGVIGEIDVVGFACPNQIGAGLIAVRVDSDIDVAAAVVSKGDDVVGACAGGVGEIGCAVAVAVTQADVRIVGGEEVVVVFRNSGAAQQVVSGDHERIEPGARATADHVPAGQQALVGAGLRIRAVFIGRVSNAKCVVDLMNRSVGDRLGEIVVESRRASGEGGLIVRDGIVGEVEQYVVDERDHRFVDGVAGMGVGQIGNCRRATQARSDTCAVRITSDRHHEDVRVELAIRVTGVVAHRRHRIGEVGCRGEHNIDVKWFERPLDVGHRRRRQQIQVGVVRVPVKVKVVGQWRKVKLVFVEERVGVAHAVIAQVCARVRAKDVAEVFGVNADRVAHTNTRAEVEKHCC